MNNEDSIATLKYLANMSIQNSKDIKENKKHYQFSSEDYFTSIDHKKAQISFKKIAQAYFKIFNGKHMILPDYAFQEYHNTYEINFDYSFTQPQYKSIFTVRYTNQHEYEIYSINGNKNESKNGSRAFYDMRKQINQGLKSMEELEKRYS